MAAEWYFTSDGQQVGPIELEALRQMLSVGSLSGSELVYGPGMNEWTPAARVPFLSAAVASAGANPSASPHGSLLSYRGEETATTGLSDMAMSLLAQTKPWVRFIGVMMYIGCGLAVLGGVAMVISGTMMMSSGRNPEPAILGVVYVVMAILYFIPAMLLNRYASRIAALMRSKRMVDVEAALAAQKSFWRFVGIMLIILLGFYLVAAVCMVAFAAMR